VDTCGFLRGPESPVKPYVFVNRADSPAAAAKSPNAADANRAPEAAIGGTRAPNSAEYALTAALTV